MALASPAGDEFTRAMLKAVNGMMLDMPAAIARKDYEDRRRRQKEGIAKAKVAGKYRGRRADEQLHKKLSNFVSKINRVSVIPRGCATFQNGQ